MIRFAAVSALALTLASAAFAGTDVNLPPFQGINAHAGSHVILKHGNVQRVTVVKGDPGKADIHVSGNVLEISPCKFWCWHVSEFKVEVVSPKIDNITAHSGGSLEAVGEFPKLPHLNLTAHSGGSVDARAIAADSINATAHSGGSLELKALSSLDATAHSGGSISFSGNPQHLSTQSHSGGSISKE